MKKILFILCVLSFLVPMHAAPTSIKAAQAYISQRVTTAKKFFKTHKSASVAVASAASILTSGIIFGLVWRFARTTPIIPEKNNGENGIPDKMPIFDKKQGLNNSTIVDAGDEKRESSNEPSREERQFSTDTNDKKNWRPQAEFDAEITGFDSTVIVRDDVTEDPEMLAKKECQRQALDNVPEGERWKGLKGKHTQSPDKYPVIEAKNDVMTNEIVTAILKDPENTLSEDQIGDIVQVVGGILPDNPKMTIEISKSKIPQGLQQFIFKHVKQLIKNKDLTSSVSLKTQEASGLTLWTDESIAMFFENSFPQPKTRTLNDTTVQLEKEKRTEDEIQTINKKLTDNLYTFLSGTRINMDNCTMKATKVGDQIFIDVHGDEVTVGKSKRKFEGKSSKKSLQKWANTQKQNSIKGVRLFVYNNKGESYEEDTFLFDMFL